MNDNRDLARDLLDHEFLDVHGMPCGRVDDIELEAGSDGTLRIVALSSGAGARSPRLPALLRWLAHRIAGSDVRRVAWDEVEKIDSAVHLRHSAHALGLDHAERRAARWIAWLPMS